MNCLRTRQKVCLLMILLNVVDSAGSVREIPDPQRTDDTNYCGDSFKCGNNKHFACTHKVRTSGQIRMKDVQGNALETDCPDLVAYVSPKQRGRFLAAVNDFRNNVVAKNSGSNVEQLTWDYRLENFAKILGTNLIDGDIDNVLWWVRLCATANSGAATAVFNLAAAEKAPDEIIVNWVLQRPGQDITDKFPMDIKTNTTPAALVCSWTALAWATATKLGCAFTRARNCNPPFPEIGSELSIAVCFVGPGSNTGDESVFIKGAPCSNCPQSTKCHPNSLWANLCARSDELARASDPRTALSPHWTMTIFLVAIIPTQL